jgi:hypothetical protein
LRCRQRQLAGILTAVRDTLSEASDRRLTPSRTWDIFLWVSAAGLLVAGAWTAWMQFGKLQTMIEGWL